MKRINPEVLKLVDIALMALLISCLLYVDSRTTEMEVKLEQARYKVRELEQRHNALAEKHQVRLLP